MSRRYDTGDVGAGLAGVVLIVAVLVLAIIVTLIVCVVSELYNIYKTRAFDENDTRSSKLLWGALVGFAGVLLVAGIFATMPATAPYGAMLGAWSTFVYTVTCIVIDRTAAKQEPPVAIPASLSLADVCSWQQPAVPERRTVS
jgi:hypothetical protein